jgi:pimeloyl-ACP methyl ester carboxylesterase
MTNEESRKPKEIIRNPDVIQLGVSQSKIEVVDINRENLDNETPVFLSMGWGGTPKAYGINILRLSKNRRVLSYKNTHGIEAKPTDKVNKLPHAEFRKAMAILAILENKKVEKTDAIGYSEGGMNILLAAILNPEKFSSIVLVNPAGLLESDNMIKLTLRFIKDLLLHFKDAATQTSAKQRKSVLFKWGRFYGGMVNSILENPVKALGEVEAMSNFNIRDIMKQLREKYGIKISIVVNKNDSAFPPDSFRDTLEGCYDDFQELEEGRHGDFVLNAKPMTKVVIEKLDKMEADAKN